MANSNLAGLRETFPSGDFTLAATSGGSTTASTSLYYWVNGYSRGGMNLLTSLGQVTVSAGQKLVWTVTNKADGDDVFGWILSANTTNDPTVAKILCVARARETVNQDAVIDPPIAMQLTRDAHFALGSTVVSLPTGSDLLDGMVRYQDGEYRQYNAETLEWETVNGWNTYLASTLTVLTPGLYKNGCDLPILSNQSIIPLPDYEGGTTPYLRLSILNGLSEGTGTVLPTGTRLSLFARLNGSDDLGGQYLSGRVEIVPRQKTRRSDGTVTALSNAPITWAYGTPFYTLASPLERGYALEFDIRVVGATLPAGVTFTFFVAEYGQLSQPTPSTPSGDLVYATGGKLRILPALLGAYRLDGAGVVDVTGETTSYPINATAIQSYSLGLQSDTANQKAAISGIGNGSIEFKTGALLPTEAVRAVVSTEAITCKPSAWMPVGAIAANASINLTVNYPCNASGKGTIRADYPDVIAGLSSGDFNPNRLRVFLRRNGSTVTESTAIAINPNTSQVFTISQVGTSATLPTDPGDSYNLWDYGTITGVSSISASDLPAGTYEVAIAYEYLGNRICKISHSTNDGCIPELSVSLSDATAIASAYSDLYDKNDSLQDKVNGLKFGVGFSLSRSGEKIVVTNDADGVKATFQAPFPTVDDDISAGYSIGDYIILSGDGSAYQCRDNTEGAAVWAKAIAESDLATVATSGSYADLSGTPTLGTAAALDAGTNANQVVQLDGSGKLPALDGSQLTNIDIPADETAIAVTVVDDGGQNEFRFNGAELTSGLLLVPGQTYRFNQSNSSNATHPLRLSATLDGTHNGGTAYSTGVTLSGTPGTDGALVFVVPLNAPEKLYPYCLNDPLVGGSSVFNTKGGGASTADTVTVDAAGFNGNLSATDIDVQTALETINGLTFTPDIVSRGTWNSGTSYAVNDVVHYPVTGNSYIANAVNTNKTPGTDPEWDLFAEKGDTGPQGVQGVPAILSIASTSTNTVTSGSKTFGFSTATNIGWAIGSRLRAIANASTYMEGVVTAITGISVTISVDYAVGSGSFSSWTIAVTGEKGEPGPAGSLTNSNGITFDNVALTPTTPASGKTVLYAKNDNKFYQLGSNGIETPVGLRASDLAEVASTGDYLDLSNRPTLGTAAALNVGTGPNQVVQLTANSRLPAVDGSLLINLPSQIPSQAGNAGKVITTNGTALSWINVLLDWNTTSTKTTNYNASNLDKIPCNTSSGSFTVTLPTSGKVWIIDIIGNSPTTGFGAIGKHLTVSPPVGQTVMGAASLILSTGAATVQLELFGTDWRIVMRG